MKYTDALDSLFNYALQHSHDYTSSQNLGLSRRPTRCGNTVQKVEMCYFPWHRNTTEGTNYICVSSSVVAAKNQRAYALKTLATQSHAKYVCE